MKQITLQDLYDAKALLADRKVKTFVDDEGTTWVWVEEGFDTNYITDDGTPKYASSEPLVLSAKSEEDGS